MPSSIPYRNNSRNKSPPDRAQKYFVEEEDNWSEFIRVANIPKQ